MGLSHGVHPVMAPAGIQVAPHTYLPIEAEIQIQDQDQFSSSPEGSNWVSRFAKGTGATL
jgi:hypothetical protein